MSRSELRGARRIGLFVPNLNGGGAERVAVNLAGAFAAEGLEVDLIAANARGQLSHTVSDSVNVHDLQCSRVRSAIPKLIRYLKHSSPKAIVSFMDHANAAAILAASMVGEDVRVIPTIHTTLSRSLSNCDSLASRTATMLLSDLYRDCKSVVAVSDGVASDLRKVLQLRGENIHVIRNPVLTADLQERSSELAPHPWLVEQNCHVFIAVGRLHPAKNFGSLLDAFAEVKTTLQCKLIILGEGSERTSLEAKVDRLGLRAEVSLPGFVPNPYAFISRASTFVLSSAWEGLPTVLIEALALGTPVVATDCESGPREILKNGAYGLLVPTHDPRALASAMLRSISEPPRRCPPEELDVYTVKVAGAEYLRVVDELS